MNDKINSIDDIQSWEDIEKCIRHFYNNKPINDFIILKKVNNDFVLMSKEDIKNIHDKKHYNCYMLPNYCLKNLEYNTSDFAFSGFNSLPRYEIIYDLYNYKDDVSTYNLLWFTGAIYEILENRYCDFWFNECNNYNENLVNNILEHILEICYKEVKNRLDILNYRYIFGGARKRFLPIDSIKYSYKYINKNIDISEINSIIDYISLVIELVKTEYSFVIIYN